MTSFHDAADASAYRDLLEARPLEEWHEGMGPKLWWKLEEVRTSNGELKGYQWAGEEPYCGSPLDLGHEVRIDVEIRTAYPGPDGERRDGERMACDPATRRIHTGGWPGYHTHFTDIVMPKVPK